MHSLKEWQCSRCQQIGDIFGCWQFRDRFSCRGYAVSRL